MTIAGWMLVMWLWGEPTIVPTPYSSVETCTEAAKAVTEEMRLGETFVCVPVEQPKE